MLSILGFLIMLAPLVIVHELGHFLFAKLFGVKAEAFSIGFGPRIFKKQIGETEWRVSAIPLGGYVKLLGEDPDAPLSPEEAKRALPNQAAWKRLFIFAGGPLFNFIWAILVYMAILAIGEPQMASVIGRVIPGTNAERAGFVSGDAIQKIDGQAVTRFEEVNEIIDTKPGQKVTFEVSRRDLLSGTEKPVTVEVTTTKQDGFSVYGEETHVGEIQGLIPNARAAVVGVSNPRSIAGQAGFHTGDTVTQVGGLPVTTWEEVERRVTDAKVGETLALAGHAKDDVKKTMEVLWKKGTATDNLGSIGLYSAEVFVETPVEDSPAISAGLKKGDRIVSVNGSPVDHFFALRESVQKAGEKDGKLELKWERDGQVEAKQIIPTATTERDALLKKNTQFTVGIIPMLAWAEPKTLTTRVLNPFTLLYRGTERMMIFTYRNFVSIKKMFTGDVSVKTLGGPILIGKIAGESLSRGLITFLGTMAILSIGLGVLNILPIPVLDGGHILLLLVETVRGKPLSLKQLEVVQGVGLSLIAVLMLVVLKNDISRLPFFN